MHIRKLTVSATLLFACYVTIIHLGCSKDELTTTNGFVVNSGPFSTGGCEWIIVTGAGSFQPINLPTEFQQTAVDSLPVEITYRVVRNKVDCPLPQNYSGVIHLNRIKQI